MVWVSFLCVTYAFNVANMTVIKDGYEPFYVHSE